MKVGDRFRLIGRTTVFQVFHTFDFAGFIAGVVGRTLDGKWETCARLDDIQRIEAVP